MSTPNRHVAILAYDQLCMFEFGIAVEIFGLPRPEFADLDWYSYEIVGIEPGPYRSTGGITVEATHDLSRLEHAGLIVVPGWRGAKQPVPAPLVDALRATHARGARIATLCSGVFVPAGAGLLSGRRATTHWRYAETLRTDYPDITVEPDILYVEDGSLLTAAGSAAGIDLCLHIVRQDFGAQVANTVARRLVLPAHREGGQAQYVARPVPRERRGRIGPLLDTLRARLDEDWSIARMADLARLSERTLIRHFNDGTGLSPLHWLIAERVERCKELLETTELDLDAIATTTGFRTQETLRHHFRARTGVSPTIFRRSFGKAA
ncbi:transcriptional regulator FtrA [Devosia sp. CN2-171]|uniref:transcriptional regulator FtrA n=1 Tax=Devosia sp. CN2-171 TaxID=3400909 RepID=UPI003BF7AA42